MIIMSSSSSISSNSSTSRCAACKYLRRRCASDCIFSPYFPSNNPHRFACVHRIYGASNVGKMLQQLPVQQRAEAADSLYYEAKCRIQDPVYGCVGKITLLHQEIYNTQSELAKTQAQIAFFNAHHQVHQTEQMEMEPPSSSFNYSSILHEQNSADLSSLYGPSSAWFY